MMKGAPFEPSPPPKEAYGLSKALDIPFILAVLLIRRGIVDPHEAREFLNPRLSCLVDPYVFEDMEPGTEILLDAIVNNKRVLIYGDYDADGITGTYCLYDFLKSLGARADYYIPNRLESGYGVHAHLMEGFKERGYSLIVTVDCGTSDIEALKAARLMGIEVVVTDHHRLRAGMERPQWPLINPKRMKGRPDLWEISGAGMAFFLIASLRRRLRQKGYFRQHPEPDIRKYLDLVSVGMVADRISLRGQARIMVANGLSQLRQSQNLAISYIKELTGLTGRFITAEDIGFRIGPRLNAPGRVDDANIVMEALISKDESSVRLLVDIIESLNNKRRQLEEGVLSQVEESIAASNVNGLPCIICHGPQWHEGVLGLVASRAASRYERPVLVFNEKDELAKGSGRSIPGIDLFEALKTQEGLLMRYGGHSGAVGVTLLRSSLDPLKEGLTQAILEASDLPSPRVPHIDMELDPDRLEVSDLEAMRSLEPFGDGNPEPTFLSRNLEIVAQRIVGNDHLKLVLRKKNKVFSAIGFGLGHLQARPQGMVDILYTPRSEIFKGHDLLDLKLQDIRPSDSP